jgi:hypothetical protein
MRAHQLTESALKEYSVRRRYCQPGCEPDFPAKKRTLVGGLACPVMRSILMNKNRSVPVMRKSVMQYWEQHIIKGRPFGVAFECVAQTLQKGHPL